MTKDTMIKHKAFKTPRLIIILFLIILKLMSTTGADFNSNTSARSHDSLHPNPQYSINEQYILDNTEIHDTIISLENTSAFITNTSVTGSKIYAGGMVEYSVIVKNCTFESSEIVLDSARNVTIISSHFIMRDLAKDEEPYHIIRIYNAGFFFMIDTHFGKQKINQYDRSLSKIETSTNIGIKLENVSIAELKECSFTGFRAEKSYGSVISLQRTEVFMISCKFHLNIAEHGVIFGKNSVNVTSKNSSFISNFAAKSGAVFYLTDSCSLSNDGSVFQNNSANEHAGVVYATDNVTINNKGCLFQYNSAENGNGGVIYGQKNIEIINTETKYIKNNGEMGGAIYLREQSSCINTHSLYLDNYASLDDSLDDLSGGGAIYCRFDAEIINNGTMFINNRVLIFPGEGGAIFLRDRASCTNINSTFQENSAPDDGGAIFGKYDVDVINIGTRSINNTAPWGGAIYMRDRVTCMNIDSIFQYNSASQSGGAIRGIYDIEVINNATRFINNTAHSGSGGVFSNSDRVKHINIGCVFLKNHAGGSGGVMGFWRGINCTIFNCNFTQNTGNFKIISYDHDTLSRKCELQLLSKIGIMDWLEIP